MKSNIIATNIIQSYIFTIGSIDIIRSVNMGSGGRERKREWDIVLLLYSRKLI